MSKNMSDVMQERRDLTKCVNTCLFAGDIFPG